MIGWQEQQQKKNYCNCGEKKNYDDVSKDASDDGGNGSVKNESQKNVDEDFIVAVSN